MVNKPANRLALLALLAVAGMQALPAHAARVKCLPQSWQAICYSDSLPAHKDHWIELYATGASGTYFAVTDADNGITVYRDTLYGMFGGGNTEWRYLYRVYSRYYLYMRNLESRGQFHGYLENH